MSGFDDVRLICFQSQAGRWRRRWRRCVFFGKRAPEDRACKVFSSIAWQLSRAAAPARQHRHAQAPT